MGERFDNGDTVVITASNNKYDGRDNETLALGVRCVVTDDMDEYDEGDYELLSPYRNIYRKSFIERMRTVSRHNSTYKFPHRAYVHHGLIRRSRMLLVELDYSQMDYMRMKRRRDA